MKKNKIFLIFIVLLIVSGLVFSIILLEGKIMKYDNETSINSLITKTYSVFDIEKMKNDIETDNMDYAKLSSQYNVQCLRKTYQGYYAVFLQNDGKHVFVFMDEKKKAYNMLVVERIRKKEEYSFLKQGKTTESEILQYDKNTMFLPISSITCSVHIVQEGLIVITYDRLDTDTGMLLNDPVVKSFAFFKNDDFPLNDNDMVNLNVPFILEKDKV